MILKLIIKPMKAGQSYVHTSRSSRLLIQNIAVVTWYTVCTVLEYVCIILFSSWLIWWRVLVLRRQGLCCILDSDDKTDRHQTPSHLCHYSYNVTHLQGLCSRKHDSFVLDCHQWKSWSLSSGHNNLHKINMYCSRVLCVESGIYLKIVDDDETYWDKRR
jgi:hypothetical protein